MAETETKHERKPIFVKCKKCGERWKVATIPMELGAFVRQTRGLAGCPNCGERKEVYMDLDAPVPSHHLPEGQ